MAPINDYEVIDDYPPRRRPYSRWEEFWDRFGPPIRNLMLVFSLLFSVGALLIALDTRGQLPNASTVVSLTPIPTLLPTISTGITPDETAAPTATLTPTPTFTLTPTPSPTDTMMPSPTANTTIFPLPEFPTAVCLGAVRTGAEAEYRSIPSISAPRLGTFAPQQRLAIMSKSGNFVYVVVGAMSGWMLEFNVLYDNPDCSAKLPTPTAPAP